MFAQMSGKYLDNLRRLTPQLPSLFIEKPVKFINILEGC